MRTPRSDHEKNRPTHLKVLHFDRERSRLEAQIRDMEGDDIIRELDRATTNELRIILRWLLDGRMRQRTPLRARRANEPPSANQSVELPSRHEMIARRIEEIIRQQERVLIAGRSRPHATRLVTLQRRYLRAIQGMLEVKEVTLEPSVRAYIRWSRIAQRTLSDIVRLQKACMAPRNASSA